MGFQKGNTLSKGKGRPKAPHTVATETARKILIETITSKMQPIANALVKKALSKDVPAIREALERSLGKVDMKVDISVKKLIDLE